MIKVMPRKQGARRKALAPRNAKPRARRRGAVETPAVFRPMDGGPESSTVGDEYRLQAESRVADDLDGEAGIDGLKRGETAGWRGARRRREDAIRT